MIQSSVKKLERPGNAPIPASCAPCGAAFDCGMEAGLPLCWCYELTGLTELDPGRGCYCRQCLEEALRVRP